MSLLLMLLYPVAIQYERGGGWRLLAPITLVAAAINVLVNYTEMALIYDLPRKGEWMLSRRLWRLSYFPGWRGRLATWMIFYTGRFDPDGVHV